MFRRYPLTAFGALLAMLLLSSVVGAADYGSDKAMSASPGASDAAATPQQLIGSWPEVSRSAADFAINKYGPPDTWSSDMLHWYGVEPFDFMVVYRDPVNHEFPVAHQDVLQQGVFYAVPADSLDELALFDGSVLVDRTKGTLSAKCDKEGANFLALNLAIDIIENRTTVNAARETYAMAIDTFMDSGQLHPYMTALNFEPQSKMMAAFTDSPTTAVAGVSRSRDTYDRSDSRGYWDECGDWVSYDSHDYDRSRAYYDRDGAVAGVSGYRGARSMRVVDAERAHDLDRGYSSGGMNDSWVWRGNERVWTGGYAWVNGNRVWVDSDNMYWSDDQWYWRDDPEAVIRFDGERMDIDADRFDVDIDRDRLEIDPDRFNIDEDRLKPELDID